MALKRMPLKVKCCSSIVVFFIILLCVSIYILYVYSLGGYIFLIIYF